MGVCTLPVLGVVCGTGEAAAAAIISPFQMLADAAVAAAAWTIDIMWAAFETTTFVDITSGHFTELYNIIFGIAVFVMLIFFLVQLLGATIRREPAALSRAVVGLGKGILGSFVALGLLATALEITDRLCLGLMSAAGTNVEEMGGRISALTAGLALSSAGGPAMPILVVIALAGLLIAASFIVWISLLVRKSLLLVAVVLAPIAFAGATWDATRGWAARWGGFVLALIASKLVVVVVFLLATAQVAAPISADLQSFADPMAGIVLMMVAGFAPYLTYKFISFMGFDMYHAMSAEQETKRAMDRPTPVPHRAAPRRAPAKVLNDQPSPNARSCGTSASPGGNRSPSAPPSGPMAAAQGGSGGSGGATGAGAAGASGGAGGSGGGAAGGAGTGAAAAGGVAAGAVIVTEAAKAGPRAGRSIADHVTDYDAGARGERS
ncbi:conjugal transfer protein TrbL [Georgenia sp. H159]|uniref:conjugal transfer protein TrbL n=1 Tax=Georgenia sp. H159 TaxID=3076115 RepID=UPI002D779C29|nr:conjugal transfer protein TrbL [Georgenia sp. H159]